MGKGKKEKGEKKQSKSDLVWMRLQKASANGTLDKLLFGEEDLFAGEEEEGDHNSPDKHGHGDWKSHEGHKIDMEHHDNWGGEGHHYGAGAVNLSHGHHNHVHDQRRSTVRPGGFLDPAEAAAAEAAAAEARRKGSEVK